MFIENKLKGNDDFGFVKILDNLKKNQSCFLFSNSIT